MNTPAPDRTVRKGFRLEPWPTAIVLFFVVVVGINLLFIRLSATSWTGLVTEKAYDKGLAFNQSVRAQERQDELGWQAALETSGLTVGRESRLTMTLKDRSDRPVTGLTFRGTLFRPVQQGMDQTFELREEEPGRYAARLSPPLPGWWEVRLTGQHPGGEYRFAQRIQLATPAGE